MTDKGSITNADAINARVQANVDEVSARLDGEIDAAWSKKSAFENRAFALFTLSLGIATLYLALREQLKLANLGPDTPWFWVLTGSLIAMGLSIIVGIVIAWPGKYKGLSGKAMRIVLDHAFDPDTRLQEQLLHVRIEELEAVLASNRRKAAWTTVGFVLAGASTLGFAVALVGTTLT